MEIVRAVAADLDALAALCGAFWPDSTIEGLRRRTPEVAGPQARDLVLIARDGGTAVEFAEIALRNDDVNGCDSSPVAFPEGIYVASDDRHQGVVRALIDAGIDWAGRHGVTEFASDAPLENHASHAFHRAVGFAETERIAYFRPVRQGIA